MRNDTGDSMEKAVKESTIFKEEVAEVFINGENTMPVGDIDQLEGHAGGTFHRVLIAASGAETAVTTEGNEFKFPAFRTAIHGTAIRRVTTMNHLLDVFNHSVARMKSIYHFFIMISEDFLQNIHMISMKKRGTKSNPLMNEGAGGAEVPKALFYVPAGENKNLFRILKKSCQPFLKMSLKICNISTGSFRCFTFQGLPRG